MLVKCQDCGADISDGAARCPRCGWPNAPRARYLALVAAAVVLAAVAAAVIRWSG
jgi:uncharacterized paraquat-inducible protein A